MIDRTAFVDRFTFFFVSVFFFLSFYFFFFGKKKQNISRSDELHIFAGEIIEFVKIIDLSIRINVTFVELYIRMIYYMDDILAIKIESRSCT